MKPSILAVLALALASLACTANLEKRATMPVNATKTPVNTPSAQIPTTSPFVAYKAVGTAYIRMCQSTSCASVGSVAVGQVVLAECQSGSRWCRTANGYIKAACLGYGNGVCQSK